MGAPITAYNRISDEPITVHSNIYEPDYVVVVDESLLETIDVTKGLKKDGAVIINSERSKEELREHLHGYEGAVYTVNAKQISLRTLGRNYPNSPYACSSSSSIQCYGEKGIPAGNESFLPAQICQEAGSNRRQYAGTGAGI